MEVESASAPATALSNIENIYFETLIVKKVIVEPKHLTTRIDEYILKYLKNEYEGKCVHEGYIQQNSIEIVKKSAGLLYGSHFTGEITYNVLFKAQVCNPVAGNEIEFVIASYNAMCVSGTLGPMQIIVPKEIHTDSDDLAKLNKMKQGDKIRIEVLKSRFYPYSKEIRVIGKMISSGNKSVEEKKSSAFITTLDDEEGGGAGEIRAPRSSGEMSDEESEEEEEEEEEEEKEVSDEEEIELSDTDSEISQANEEFNMKDPNEKDGEESSEEEEDFEDDVSMPPDEEDEASDNE